MRRNMRLGLRVLSLAFSLSFFAGLPDASAADEPKSSTPASAAPGSATTQASTATPKPEEAPLSTVGTGLAPTAPVSTTTTPAPPPPAPGPAPAQADDGPPKFEFFTLLQPQFIDTIYNSAASPNVDAVTGLLPNGIGANDVIAKADGGTTNSTMFRMRRTRLGFKVNPFPEASAKLDVELLPQGTNGIFWRDAFVTGHAKWSPNVTTDFNLGSLKVPFSSELIESDRTRPFIERSMGARAFFPAEFDLGVWLETRMLKKRLRIDLAVLNGVTIGEKAYNLSPDLNRAKDFTAHINYDFGPLDIGASFYGGAGQLVDPKALRTKSYGRWAGHGELALHHTFVKPLGPTRLYTEFTIGKNMDRGTIYAFGLPSIPTNINDTAALQKTGMAMVARFEQRLGKQFLAGFRYDNYTPQMTEASNTYHSFSPMLALYFIEQMRLSGEYSYIRDNAHAPGGKPSGHEIHVITTYVHAAFEL